MEVCEDFLLCVLMPLGERCSNQIHYPLSGYISMKIELQTVFTTQSYSERNSRELLAIIGNGEGSKRLEYRFSHTHWLLNPGTSRLSRKFFSEVSFPVSCLMEPTKKCPEELKNRDLLIFIKDFWKGCVQVGRIGDDLHSEVGKCFHFPRKNSSCNGRIPYRQLVSHYRIPSILGRPLQKPRWNFTFTHVLVECHGFPT